jgi:RNA polymerase sigma-70 factor (ECF subfamily)
LSPSRVEFTVGELDARAKLRIAAPADADATPSALLEQLRRGDGSAFDEVYRHYTPSLFAFLARLAGRAAIAEELLQETWLRLATHARTLAPDTNLRAWLFTVARNLDRSHRRRVRLDLDLLRFWKWASREQPSPPSPHDLAVLSEAERRLDAALTSLPLAQREILLLVAVEGFSPSHAAEILNLRPEAARQRLRRARAAVGAALETASPLRSPEGETS